jgi:glycosyltransferase involved in cell wall biosynthesis
VFSPRVVVVNDGSDEEFADIFKALKSMGCDVLTHPHNLGKGAALKTGIGHALSVYRDACGIVTADADGQHSLRDIRRLAERLAEGANGIVLGVRHLDNERVPFKSRWGNKITSFIFRLKTGIKLCDTQTGLRAIPMRYAFSVLQAPGSRFEYETNMLLYANKRNIPFITVSIDTIYQDKNSSSHFRAVRDSARIYFDLLKFSLSSGICAAVDFGLFILFSSLVFDHDHLGIVTSTVLARVVSGTCNFLINQFVVFHGKGRRAPAKYFLLFLAQMFFSAQFTALLARNLFIAPIAKLIVDGILFVLSFIIQRKFIFRRDSNQQ